MKRKISRLFSLALVLILLADSMPATVYASEGGSDAGGSAVAETTITDVSENDEEEASTEEPSKESGEPESGSEEASTEEPWSEVPSAPVSGNDLPVEGGGASIAAVDQYIYIDEANFPDDDFRSFVKKNYDVNKDGRLNPYEIRGVTEMDLSDSGFKSLEGIQYFTELTSLYAKKLNLTELNVNGMTKLEYLDCSDNKLTSLDVSGCESLETLDCSYNQLTSLDNSNCRNLEVLNCRSNQLTSLSIIASLKLKKLYCDYNQLTALNVSGCTGLSELNCGGNRITSLNILGCNSLQKLECYNNELTTMNVSYCTALKQMSCSNNQLSSLDVSKLTSLESLSCTNNQLTSLDVSSCTVLSYLYCNDNQLTSLDVIGCTYLKKLHCYGNQLTSLNVSGCTLLWYLYCNDNQLTNLDVSNCSNLNSLNCENNKLRTLDISSNTSPNFRYLYCSGNEMTSLLVNSGLLGLYCSDNLLTSLDVSKCGLLESLDCSDNLLTSLNVSRLTSLNRLYCDNNQLATLDVSNAPALTTLCCANNRLTSLDVSSCEALTTLWCGGNQYQIELKNKNKFFYFDLSGLPEGFDPDKCSDWRDETAGSALDGPDTSMLLKALTGSTQKVTYRYDCGGGFTADFTLCTDAVTTTPETGIAIDEAHFPDEDFRSIVSYYDMNRDGLLSDRELEAVETMECMYYSITNLTGIEYFTSLVSLTIVGQYEELNLSNLPKLTYLELDQHSSVDILKVSGCTSLETLKCGSVSLRSLQVSACPNLQYLECEENPLVSVKLIGLALKEAKGLKNADGSRFKLPATEIELDENNQFDLSTLPGFAVNKASGWNGGTVSGNILTLQEGSGEVRFLYDCGSNIVVEMTLKVKGIEGLWISAVPNQLYTGQAIKPQVEVYCGEKKLAAGKHYTISYKNNTNAASLDAVDKNGKSIAPTITVKGKGNYTGTATKTFTITPIHLTKLSLDAELKNFLTIEPVYAKYSGKVIKGKPVIKFRGKTLSSSLYSLEYKDTVTGAYQEEGAYNITITGKGPNVIGTCTVKEYITKNLMSRVSIGLENDSVPYNRETGISHPGAITVMDGSTRLYAGIDFFVSYQNDDRIGTATVVITGNEDAGWYGVKTKTYKITGTKLTAAMVTQKTKDFKYNIYRHYLSDSDYVITDGETTLVENKDFVISYPGAEKTYTEPGSFKVTFTGIGAYSGSVTKTWKIQKASLTELMKEDDLYIDYDSSVSYAKGGAKPVPGVVEVYVKGYSSWMDLTEGVDYTVTYVNNGRIADEDDAKAPYFYLTGKGCYTGNTKLYPCKFSIKPAEIGACATIMAEDVLYKDKNGNFIPSVTVVDNATGKKLAKGTDYESTFLYEYAGDEEGEWIGINTTERVDASKERVKMRITITGKGNYKETITDTYEVYPKSINTSSVVVKPIPAQTYTGKAITPTPEVSLKVKEGNTYKTVPLTEGVDYTVKYSKNVLKGTATVYIYGKGEYGGVKKVTFKITEKKLQWWQKLFS